MQRESKRSREDILKMTLGPSFHISVTTRPRNEAQWSDQRWSSEGRRRGKRTERLSRVYDASEPDLEVFPLAKGLEDVLSSDTKRAETVEDGVIEPSHLGKGRIQVERVEVAGESVKSSLAGRRLLLDDGVGLPRRRLVGSRGRSSVTSVLLSPESPASSKDDGPLVLEDELAVLVGRLGGRGDGSGFSLSKAVRKDELASVSSIVKNLRRAREWRRTLSRTSMS
jgi:hypothetical protein